MVGVIEISGRDRHTLGEEGTHLPVTWTERRLPTGKAPAGQSRGWGGGNGIHGDY